MKTSCQFDWFKLRNPKAWTSLPVRVVIFFCLLHSHISLHTSSLCNAIWIFFFAHQLSIPILWSLSTGFSWLLTLRSASVISPHTHTHTHTHTTSLLIPGKHSASVCVHWWFAHLSPDARNSEHCLSDPDLYHMHVVQIYYQSIRLNALFLPLTDYLKIWNNE